MAISDESDCDPQDDETGYSGNCGKEMTGIAFMILYLVLSFLIIVNMYIAVILENYSQVCCNNHRGKTCVCACCSRA